MAQQVRALLGCCALFLSGLESGQAPAGWWTAAHDAALQGAPQDWCSKLQCLAAGGIEEGTITFEPCATLVDDWVVVNETDIAAAMVRVEAEHAIRIEGGLSKSLMT